MSEFFKRTIDKIVAILIGILVNLITPQKDIVSCLIVLGIMVLFFLIYYYVYCRWPKILGIKTAYAATGIVFNHDYTKILLSYHKKQQMWIPPGGHIRDTELLHEKVIEYIKKESGYAPKFISFHDDSKFDNICTIVPQPFRVQIEKQTTSEGHKDHYDFLYILTADEKDQNVTHSLDSKWYTLDEIKALVGRRETYNDVLDIVNVALKIVKEVKNSSEVC